MRRPTGRRSAALAVALFLLAACDEVSSEPTVAEQARDREVTIPADGLDLAGTLRLPGTDGPHTGIVIAHGSGPQSRRGVAPGQLGLTLPQPVPVYEELAEGLRDAGFAVLTFDKRSCGAFNGCADNGYPAPPEEVTFDTFVADVATVVDHLIGLEEVDRAVLLGHSKGGTIAAHLAGERADLDGVVLLAAPALPIHEVLAAQADTLADLVERAGQSEQAAAVGAVEEVRALAGEVAAIAGGQVGGGPVGGAPQAFWASWIDASRTAPEVLAAAATPVLVLGGEADWNVPPDQLDAWRPALDEGDQLEILPAITHALTRLDGDDPASVAPADLGTRVEPAVIDTIAAWLRALE